MMKNIKLIVISIIFIVFSSSVLAIPAFPEAEGWGAESVGGRGGRVIEVTNLNDDGLGSLRSCASAPFPRTCVFKVAGIINLERTIRISKPFITIAGQTAPGDGITLKGGGFLISTHDVIVRYIHYRGGSNSFITLRPWNDAHDIIIDQCSASGGENDIIDIHWNDNDNDPDPDLKDITVQNCIIAEADKGHPTGMLASGSSDLGANPPRVGSSLVHHISIHNNYFVHNDHRNPLIKSAYTEVINNVVYNWGNRIGGTGDTSQSDWINNYWKGGPMTTGIFLVFEWLDPNKRPFPLSSVYIAGNIVPFFSNDLGESFELSDPNKDNWFLFRTHHAKHGIPLEIPPEANRRFTPLVPAPIPVTIEPALTMFNSVVTNAGANKRLNGDGTFTDNRDEADQKLIDDFYDVTGPAKYQDVTVTIPSFIDPGTPYADTDKDGMADEWETLNGFDPNDASDGPLDADGDGYTNLEEFLNGGSTTPPVSLPPTPIPELEPTLTPIPTGPDTTPPIISNPKPIGTLSAGTTQTTISVTTNEPATCGGSTTPGVIDDPTAGLFTNTGGTTHSVTVPVKDGKSYEFYVRCIDKAGNINAEDLVMQFSVAQPLVKPKVPKQQSKVIIFIPIIVIIVLILLVVLVLKRRKGNMG